jgi:hypothetical protein
VLSFLHDNAHPHTTAHTTETPQKLYYKVLEHPPCSPDPAPLDYQLSGPLKDALRVHCFAINHTLKEAVHMWLAAQNKTFFSEGKQKLV